ncbi:c-type cytochrome [Pseudomonas sp. 5P_3.1_Bac2]|uniref:c-type cytochrome n=1 Tax=Pseudomonas sp. 5P_3.1_Bac2 TaxID=2971617 RepID=UPI0021C86D56|nr:cytochrome c [Pseudomonas sp. 5P_3.1_Bac2]MCU1718429.1 cytochrome c [Pseudomonas sp. 5P_3.1_Bac2]
MKLKSLLVLATVLTLTACGGVDPNSPEGQRQAIFKQMLKVSENLGGMIRGRVPFNADEFVLGAAELDKLGRTPWQHFPQVQDDGQKTRAKADVWQRQERFQQLAKELEASTAALVVASKSQPLQASAVAAPIKQVEGTCKACHEEFRAF